MSALKIGRDLNYKRPAVAVVFKDGKEECRYNLYGKNPTLKDRMDRLKNISRNVTKAAANNPQHTYWIDIIH